MEAKNADMGESYPSSVQECQFEPVGDWIAREFDFIPTHAVSVLYELGRDQLERLDRPDINEQLIIFPAGWVVMFHPRELEIERFIKQNPAIIADCGFLVYDSESFGILLGMDKPGFVFYSECWEKLQRTLLRIK